jgi:hypothetical protein
MIDPVGKTVVELVCASVAVNSSELPLTGVVVAGVSVSVGVPLVTVTEIMLDVTGLKLYVSPP